MAHFQIDYSPNLADRLDIALVCERVRLSAIDTGVFPPAGIRVRALAVDHVTIADGAAHHAFLDLVIRLRGGRNDEAKKRATAQIFATLEDVCADVMASSSLHLSMELRDIDPELSPKASSTRNYLPEDMR